MTRRRIKPTPVGRADISIHLQKIRIRNTFPSEFKKRVLEVPLKAYEVENLSDGRRICITKPGGKSVDDLMVWVLETEGKAHWRPSHGLIHQDLAEKLNKDLAKGKEVIEALQRVFIGDDPDDIIAANPQLGTGLPGLPVDLILKAYKWIWVQEDCNYPPPKYQGRAMSMESIKGLLSKKNA